MFMLEAVAETAHWTLKKVEAIQELIQSTASEVKSTLPTIYTKELVELIFMKPYCRISDLVESDIAKRQTASSYLKQLTAAGILREVSRGKEKLKIQNSDL